MQVSFAKPGLWAMLAAALILGMLAAAVFPPEADGRSPEIVGVASVIDGDTIEIHDRRIRLDGIDAPKSAQVCLRAGERERCGQASAFYLADLIARKTVRCVPHDVDRYGRDIATCWLADTNLNQRMVETGQAVAYRKYSMRYVAAETEAEAGRQGIWATEFTMPWEWRRAH